MPDVIVIGAGVVGAAVAHALVAAGATVCVLEADDIAGGTSAATFAVDVSRVKTPRALFDLSVASVHEHQALERATGVSWRHPTAWLEWDDSLEGRDRIRERSRRLRSWGHAAESVSPEQAREVEPVLALPAGVDDVALYPGGAWYEPPVMARALLDRASAGGARVRIHDPVTAMKSSRGRITELTTASGRRSSADLVVLCAGPQSGALAARARARLAVRRVPGLIVTTTPASTGLRTIVSADDLNLRPERGDRVLLHSWMADGELGPANAATLAEGLLRRARTLLPGLARAEVQSARVGVRPVPVDGLPLVGPLPEPANLYAVVAHSAVQLAPILGRLAARELNGDCEPDLHAFRPARASAQEDGETLDESARTMLARIGQRKPTADRE